MRLRRLISGSGVELAVDYSRQLLRRVIFPRDHDCGPVWEPSKWNVEGVQDTNNYYNYACDVQTDTDAQPGRASGTPWTMLTCRDVGLAARRDGLLDVGPNPECGCAVDCCYPVALVIAPFEPFSEYNSQADYHFYRRDRNGLWSHKPGHDPATNLDNHGQPITDPRTAARWPYREFCGFFCVCRELVQVS